MDKNLQTFAPEHTGNSKKKFFEFETKRELVFPINYNVAMERIKNAFASEIVVSKSFWSTIICIGHINENEILVTLINSGGGKKIIHKIYGRFSLYGSGTKLILLIRDNTPIGLVLIIAAFVVPLWRISHVFEGIFVGILFGVFVSIGGLFHRIFVADKITSLMRNIILTTPPALATTS